MKSLYPIILASNSPRRKELLAYLDIPFLQIGSDADETNPTQLSYALWAETIARRKAAEIYNSQEESSIVLAADTMVFLNGNPFGKPQNEKHAFEMLSELSGKVHEIITGVSLMFPEGEMMFSVLSTVELSELTRQEIEYYIDKFSPLDKAGSYGVQDWMGMLKMKAIHGSYSNVMGLPMYEVEKAMKKHDLITF